MYIEGAIPPPSFPPYATSSFQALAHRSPWPFARYLFSLAVCQILFFGPIVLIPLAVCLIPIPNLVLSYYLNGLYIHVYRIDY